jgi:hypothetical protein
LRGRIRPIVLGFYTDESGNVRPLTVSAGEKARKKIIKKPKKFKGVFPGGKKGLGRSLAEAFWELHGKLDFQMTNKEVSESVSELFADWVTESKRGAVFSKAEGDYVKKVRETFGKDVADKVEENIDLEAASTFYEVNGLDAAF